VEWTESCHGVEEGKAHNGETSHPDFPDPQRGQVCLDSQGTQRGLRTHHLHCTQNLASPSSGLLLPLHFPGQGLGPEVPMEPCWRACSVC
jgi:hypothetical protein